MFVAPRDIGVPYMRVLVADASSERSNTFRLKSAEAGSGYQLRVVHTLGTLQTSLAEPKPWDVVIHSLFLGDWSTKAETYAEPLVQAFKAKHIRGVICNSPIEVEARQFIASLRRNGVPSVYVPFNYTNPGNHLKLRFPDIKYQPSA